MSYMKQNKKHKQTLESVQYGLEIIFNSKFWQASPPFHMQSLPPPPTQHKINQYEFLGIRPDIDLIYPYMG